MCLAINFPLDAEYAHKKRPENIKDLASGYCSVARVLPDLLSHRHIPLPFRSLTFSLEFYMTSTGAAETKDHL